MCMHACFGSFLADVKQLRLPTDLLTTLLVTGHLRGKTGVYL